MKFNLNMRHIQDFSIWVAQAKSCLEHRDLQQARICIFLAYLCANRSTKPYLDAKMLEKMNVKKLGRTLEKIISY